MYARGGGSGESAHVRLIFRCSPIQVSKSRVLVHMYCKFRNFRENFIFAKKVERHIYDVKKSRLVPDLPTSVND